MRPKPSAARRGISVARSVPEAHKPAPAANPVLVYWGKEHFFLCPLWLILISVATFAPVAVN